MTKIFNYKKNAFIAGVVMTLFMGTAWGSSAPSFDVLADVEVLNQCFNGEHGDPDDKGQYKLDTRRYVNFDVTARCDDVRKSLLPLGADTPLGQRVFHERTYEVAGKAEVGPSVLVDLQTKGVKLFVRSSPLKFDSEYWALYELLVPVVAEPKIADVDDKTFDLPSGESIRLSDLPTLHDEGGKSVFTQYFFGIYYRELT